MKKKFLTICYHGHCRSVACARELHGRGHQAVPVGAHTSPGAVPLLGDWADHIILMQPGFVSVVPQALLNKVKVFDVGPDRWVNPYHPELAKMVKGMVDKEGW